MPKRASFSISRNTYWLLCGLKERYNEQLTQIQIIQRSVVALQKAPEALKSLTKRSTGNQTKIDYQILSAAYGTKTKAAISALAESFGLKKSQVLDFALTSFLANRYGIQQELPSDPINVSGYPSCFARSRIRNHRGEGYDLSRLIDGSRVFIDATVMFAGITRLEHEDTPAMSQQAAEFLKLCSQGCFLGFTSVWEIARLETFLVEYALDKAAIPSYLESLIRIFTVIDSLRTDILIPSDGVSGFTARASVAAFLKHGECASIATATRDFDASISEFSRRRPKFRVNLCQPLDCLIK